MRSKLLLTSASLIINKEWRNGDAEVTAKTNRASTLSLPTGGPQGTRTLPGVEAKYTAQNLMG